MIASLDKWLRKRETKGKVVTRRHFRVYPGWALELIQRNTGDAQYRGASHWKVRLCDVDPDHVCLEDYDEEHPYLLIYTRFLREVVTYRTWSSTAGYVRFRNSVSMYVPVRKKLPSRELSELKGELTALQGGEAQVPDPSDNLDLPRLRRRVKELKGTIENLANTVDFSAHAGAGVVEQNLTICENTLNLTLWQLRKYSADSPGSRITTVVPLYQLSRENLWSDRPNPNPGALGRGIPPVWINAQCDHLRLRQHFVNPDKEFKSECYREELFVPALEDTVLFGQALHELIGAARELLFHGG